MKATNYLFLLVTLIFSGLANAHHCMSFEEMNTNKEEIIFPETGQSAFHFNRQHAKYSKRNSLLTKQQVCSHGHKDDKLTQIYLSKASNFSSKRTYIFIKFKTDTERRFGKQIIKALGHIRNGKHGRQLFFQADSHESKKIRVKNSIYTTQPEKIRIYSNDLTSFKSLQEVIDSSIKSPDDFNYYKTEIRSAYQSIRKLLYDYYHNKELKAVAWATIGTLRQYHEMLREYLLAF